MPNYRILWTTDGRHMGKIVELVDGHMQLPNGYLMPIESTAVVAESIIRFCSSNYIIDAEEMPNG